METNRLAFVLYLVTTSQGIAAIEWTSPFFPSGSTVHACVGETVRLPWNFTLSDSELLTNVEWYQVSDGGERPIAGLIMGDLMRSPSSNPTLTHIPNAGLQFRANWSDFGAYRVRVKFARNGTLESATRTASVHLPDAPVLEGGRLSLRSLPGSVVNEVTQSRHVQLACGHFLQLGTAPVSVGWTTPSGLRMNSTSYSNGYFLLDLPNPVEEGVYSCHLDDPEKLRRCVRYVAALTRGAVLHVDGVGARQALLQADLKEVQGQVKDNQRELRRQEEADDSFTVRADQLSAANGRLQEDVGRLEEKDSNLKASVDRLAVANDRTQELIEDLQEADSNLTAWAGILSDDDVRLQSELDRLSEKDLNLISALEQAQSEMTRQQITDSQLGSRIENVSSDFLERLLLQKGVDAKLQSDGRQLKSKTGQLESETSQLKSDISRLKSKTGHLESETNQLRSQTGKLESDRNRLESKTGQLESETSQLKSDTSQLKSDTSQLKSDTSQLKSDTSQLKSDTSQLKSDTSQLKSDTSQLKSEKDRLRADLEAVRSGLSTELQALRTRLNNFKAGLHRARLVGGRSSLQGRLEVFVEGRWGTVCDDDFEAADAQVACRMLGFSGSGAVAHHSAHFGQGSGPILLDNMACSGQEEALTNCNYDPDTTDCSHSEDVGVTCRL